MKPAGKSASYFLKAFSFHVDIHVYLLIKLCSKTWTSSGLPTAKLSTVSHYLPTTRSLLRLPKVLRMRTRGSMFACCSVAATRITMRVIQNRVSISQSRKEIPAGAQHGFVFCLSVMLLDNQFEPLICRGCECFLQLPLLTFLWLWRISVSGFCYTRLMLEKK